MARFSKKSALPAPPDEILAWHGRPGAFERLNPPWEPAQVVRRDGGIAPGDRVELRVGPAWGSQRWVAEHRALEEGDGFVDVQVEGPFKRWEHRHIVRAGTDGEGVLEDDIHFELPMGGLGRALGGSFVRGKLESVFAYRHRLTRDDLALHRRFADRPRMRVLLTGGSGLIGRSLVPLLGTGGHTAVRLQRGAGANQWDPARGRLEPGVLDGIDAVVHLSGANVGGGRWTAARRAEIVASRLDSTRLLIEGMAASRSGPRVLVCASASGYYGPGGDEWFEEDDPAGRGFLADVCRQWEEAAGRARDLGVRLVCARIGVVLTPAGGALQRMLPFFGKGLGGPIGSGRQYMSWIGLDDALGGLYAALMDDALVGPVNLTAPEPVTSAAFSRALGRVLRRPALVPVPAAVIGALWGQMGREILLEGNRVRPRRLLESGYVFRFSALEEALAFYLGKI